MTQHTPGPWKYVGHNGTFFITQTADGSEDGYHSFAKCYPATYHPTGWEACKNESEANARLIAAAPMLLAALERAIPMLIRLGDFIGNGDIDYTRPDSLGSRCDLIGDARAATRAARGEN